MVPASLQVLDGLGEDLRGRLASLEEGVVVHDRDGRIQAASPAASRLLGAANGGLIGRTSPLEVGTPFDEAGAPLEPEACPSRACRTSRERQPERVVRLDRADGRVIYLAFTSNPLETADGVFAGVVTSFLDVTDRRLADETRARIYEEARHALRTRDELIATAAHELRTPLTALHLQLSALHRNVTGPRPDVTAWAEKVKTALRQTERMNFLVEVLLDVARISTGRLELSRRPVDLREIAVDCVERFRDELERAGCPLTVHAASPAVGEWDGVRLDQVVTNLLTNAAKYGRGQPVEIEVGTMAGFAKLVVRDFGIGIRPEDQARIFGRFERAETDEHFGGLGIGLWVVREIVEAHGGRIELSSQPGEGSTFTVMLPLSPT